LIESKVERNRHARSTLTFDRFVLREKMDVKAEIETFQDYLAPKLDAYEQAIYLYIFRHSRLQGKEEVTIGFHSARRKIAFGKGESRTPMSQRTCYEKLRSLESKGFLKVLGTEHGGTKIRLLIPSEIWSLVVPQKVNPITLEEMDFFAVPENRLAILRRETINVSIVYRRSIRLIM
jgi:hypothetical protein